MATETIQAPQQGVHPKLQSKSPSGPMAERWTKHKFDLKLINPANRRKFKVLVVGTGLAGSSASATLAEMERRGVASALAARRAPALANCRAFS